MIPAGFKLPESIGVVDVVSDHGYALEVRVTPLGRGYFSATVKDPDGHIRFVAAWCLTPEDAIERATEYVKFPMALPTVATILRVNALAEIQC